MALVLDEFSTAENQARIVGRPTAEGRAQVWGNAVAARCFSRAQALKIFNAKTRREKAKDAKEDFEKDAL